MEPASLTACIDHFHSVRDEILRQVRQVIVGQTEVLDQILIAFSSGGDIACLRACPAPQKR